MRTFGIALMALALAAGARADSPKLVKLWETPAELKVPESVLADMQRKVLYVSNIDGKPWEPIWETSWSLTSTKVRS